MFRKVTELVVRMADLAEAEGKMLRGAAVRLALGIGVIALSVTALGFGVVLLLGALYIFVSDQAGPAVGAMVTGGVAVATGGLLAWTGYRIGR